MSPATVKTQVPKLNQGVLANVLFLIPNHVLLGWTFGGNTSSECHHVSVSTTVLLCELFAFHGYLGEKQGHLHTCDSICLLLLGGEGKSTSLSNGMPSA